jgi:hypothetical protein
MVLPGASVKPPEEMGHCMQLLACEVRAGGARSIQSFGHSVQFVEASAPV